MPGRVEVTVHGTCCCTGVVTRFCYRLPEISYHNEGVGDGTTPEANVVLFQVGMSSIWTGSVILNGTGGGGAWIDGPFTFVVTLDTSTWHITVTNPVGLSCPALILDADATSHTTTSASYPSATIDDSGGPALGSNIFIPTSGVDNSRCPCTGFLFSPNGCQVEPFYHVRITRVRFNPESSTCGPFDFDPGLCAQTQCDLFDGVNLTSTTGSGTMTSGGVSLAMTLTFDIDGSTPIISLEPVTHLNWTGCDGQDLDSIGVGFASLPSGSCDIPALYGDYEFTTASSGVGIWTINLTFGPGPCP